MNQDESLRLLKLAGLFFETDPRMLQTINMNDTWGCGADGEDVPDEELPEVGRLFRSYGWCGVLYWASERNDKCKSEFHDINRFIEFVRHEEAIREEMPSLATRAYTKRAYTIGE